MNESETQAGLSCLTKIIIAMVVVPLLLVLATGIWWFSRQSIARGQLNEKLAELRTDGLPVDAASLQKFYERQTDAFQADRWIGLLDRAESSEFRKAALAMPILGRGQDVPIAADAPWPDDVAVRQFLADQKTIFTEIADLRDSVVGTRYQTGFANQTPAKHITETRTLSRLLALRHQVALRDQDASTAADCILSMIAVARSIEGQVTIVDQSIRLANLNHAVMQIRFGLAAGAYDADGLRQIGGALDKRADASSQLGLAIQGERAFMLNAYQSMQASTSMSPVTGPSAMLYTVGVYNQFADAITPDVFDSVQKIQAISDQVARDRQTAGFVAQMDSALTPQLGQTFGSFSRSEMQCRLVATAVHIRLYQATHETWPTSLADLNDVGFSANGHAPPGPKPFGYRVEPNGMAIVWGFPLQATQDLPGMTETPDEPPRGGEPSENDFVFELAPPATS